MKNSNIFNDNIKITESVSVTDITMYQKDVSKCDLQQLIHLIQAEIRRQLIEEFQTFHSIWDRINNQKGVCVNKKEFAQIFNPSFDARFTNALIKDNILSKIALENWRIKGTSKYIPVEEARRIVKLWERGVIKLRVR